MTTTRFAVVGAGLAGAATAWQLARRGHDVTVLERSEPANPAGSSHGSARIFRYTYHDPFYTQLVIEARAEWTVLERLAATQLITPTGSLDFGSRRDPVGLARILEKAGVEHELLSRDEARRRWPQIAFDTETLWHPAAGVIDAESAVRTMLDLAQRDGAVVETGWPVASVERTRSGRRLLAEDGRTVDAGHVVVSAGGWLPELLGALSVSRGFLSAFPGLAVMQENAFHFPYRDAPTAATWPTFIHKSPTMQTYSLPGGHDAGGRGQKLAEFNGGRRIRGASDQTGEVDQANRRRVTAYVERTLPGLVPASYAETTCLFTNTATEDFVIDTIDGITIVAPCSGHGAKFAPLIGRIAAASALGTAAPAAFRVGAA